MPTDEKKLRADLALDTDLPKEETHVRISYRVQPDAVERAKGRRSTTQRQVARRSWVQVY